MSTGYTNVLINGMSAKDFIKETATAFGIFFKKDDTESNSDDNYDVNEYEKADKELRNFKKLSYKKKLELFNKEKQKEIEHYTKYLKNTRKENKIFNDTLALVNKLDVKTESLVEYKKFLIDQLKTSISPTDYAISAINNFKKMEFNEWKDKKIKNLEWHKHYHQENMSKKSNQLKSDNEFKKELLQAIAKL